MDVVVIGGGAAGLAAGVALARSRRSVVVVDAGQPRNSPAAGVHNLLGREGITPHELSAAGRRELTGYGGIIRDGRAVSAVRTDAGFAVGLDDTTTLAARRLIVASGLVDELPDVAGLAARWGRDVLHCPYCHGWEVRDHAIGVLSTGPMAVHQALLFRQLSADVVLFAHTGPEPDAEQRAQLRALSVRVIRGRVAAVETTNDQLSGVRLADGHVVTRQALVVAPRAVARSQVLDSLGLQAVPHPLGSEVGLNYPTLDSFGRTAVDGVWLAGNVADMAAQVGSSAASGVGAAAAVNLDLIGEDVRRAVAAVPLGT